MTKRDPISNQIVCSSELRRAFTTHPPTGDQQARYAEINQAALEMAATIEQHCPPGPWRDAAILAVKDASMRANAAIATSGRPPAIVPSSHGA
jgi:hypothetical protein